MTNRDRAIGALVGLAVGDALGTSVEFKERDTYEPVTTLRGGGAFRLQPGEWTDDTSMALALSDSLIENNGEVNAMDLLRRFTDWYENGTYSTTGRCFDIGTTTREALLNFKRFGLTVAPDQDHLSGNGSIMRLAPAAIVHHRSYDDAVRVSIDQSVPTHNSTKCRDACEELALIISAGIRGEDQGLNQRIKDIPRDQISSSGYVLDTLVAAQWAVLNTSTFDDAVLLAANLGDDADTVAAVTGQIAGSLYGYSAIREEWRNMVFWHERLVDDANSLYNLKNPSPPE